jgi:hypothetical protein
MRGEIPGFPPAFAGVDPGYGALAFAPLLHILTAWPIRLP